jgi:hypothetical protein
MKEVENVIRIFQEARTNFIKRDFMRLKDLSNQTINTASFSQDPDNIAVAVIVYSIGKISESEENRQLRGWNKFEKNILDLIDIEIKALKKQDQFLITSNLAKLRKEIDSFSGKIKKYIQEILTKAAVNKASRIYEHGVSMEKTANLLGISVWELSNYVGNTNVSNSSDNRGVDIKKRIKLAEEIFGI